MREWAVVVGAGLNALGVVRSLGRAGVNVAVVSKASRSPATLSRREARTFRCSDYKELPDRLLSVAAELGGHPVLFLTEEEAVQEVSLARQSLEKALRLRMPLHSRLLELSHKDGIQALAGRFGFPIPNAVRLNNDADCGRLDALRYPCVLKPSVKDADYGARFKKAYLVSSPEEAAILYREIAPVLPDMVVQEWIDGPDDSIFFCLQYVGENGDTVASFTGRKLRSWPPRVGGTASCVAAPDVEGALSALTTEFFRAVEFQGMGSVEYKRDVRDGRFYIVEPTVGRTDFQEEVATINGNNIPYAAYCYECGLPAPASRPTAPTIWREPTTDRWSEELQGPHPLFRRTRVCDGYFRFDDPMPWLALQWSRIKGKVSQLAR